jgi:aminoglycoside 3-N-acetyltransferase
MPTHSTQYSDRAQCTNPLVPDECRPIIRAERPPYRPAVTPTRDLGAVPACFRGHPSVIRSQQPGFSFAPRDADAQSIANDHS